MKKLLASITAASLLSGSALADNVAIFGNWDTYANSYLTGQGHSVTNISIGELESGLGGYDLLLFNDRSLDMTANACNSIDTFLSNGNALISEWNGATSLFTTQEPGIYYGSLVTCNFFAGTVGNGSVVATGTPIDILDAGSPLVTGLADGFNMGGGSEFFYTLSGFDPIWDIVAEYTGHGGTWPAIMQATYNTGLVIIGPMDYQDSMGVDANAQQLFRNFADAALAHVPGQPPAPEPVAVPLSNSAKATLLLLFLAAAYARLRKQLAT